MAANTSKVSQSFERPKTKSFLILKRLGSYLSHFRYLLVLAVILSIVCNLLMLLGPKLSGYAVDAIGLGSNNVNFKQVQYYVILMIICYVISSVLSYLLAVLFIQLSKKVVFQLRQDAYEHIMKLPIRFFDTTPIGDVLSILSYDIDTINASLSNDLVQLFASVISVVGSFAMMLSIAPILVSVFVVTIPCSILLTRYRSKKVRPLYRNRSISLGELNGYSEEITNGIKTIRAYHQEDYFQELFEIKNIKACDANYQAEAFAATTGPSVNFINNISLALISIFGTLLFINHTISLGSVSSFVLYSRKFSGPINEFANIVNELQSTLAACERVFRLLDEQVEKEDASDSITLEHVEGDIKLQNISFSYVENTPVLTNYTLHAKPGQVVAIVGPTGAGKTTIINLLMRFYEVNSGSILLDGINIYDIKRESLRKSFSVVSQDTWLFTGSVFENLAYGKENVHKDDAIHAAKAAKIHDFIMSLPQGYETILQDGGGSISKGQKQLLTIARAMLMDAPILILDEATSNVDTQSEQDIQSAMLKLMEGRTCFVIAHRLSTIREADAIAVLSDGKVLEYGAHKELLKAKGYYHDLYNAQFDEYD